MSPSPHAVPDRTEPTTPRLADAFAGQHLVVTGFTGFVGKVWISLLLSALPDLGHLTLLVRPGRRQSALSRVAAIFDTSPALRPVRAIAGPDLAAYLTDRLTVVEADCALPGLGIDPTTAARLAQQADVVVHLAGLTDFHPDPAKGVPANVHGAVHAADLAATLRVPRLVHISTCFVAGRADGEVPEALEVGHAPFGSRFDPAAELAWLDELLATERDATTRTDRAGDRAAALGWANLYTYTKALAEHLLAQRTDIELTIVRPAVVECAQTFPLPGWNEGLNTSAPVMWFATTAFRELPSHAHHRFDVVPVDAVARWLTLATAAALRDNAQPVYQLGSSDINPVTFDRICELTSLAIRRDAKGAKPLQRLLAQFDTVAAPRDQWSPVNPSGVQGLGDRISKQLGTWSKQAAAQGAPALAKPLKSWRRTISRASRDVGRLAKILDIYQPFLHDHDWAFCTANIRAAVQALHPDDVAVFGDDLTQLCWRDYWMNVQFPGVQRWAFPIMRGERAHLDPASDPPLSLAQAAAATARTARGAA